jgi:hypothetical protein
MIGLAITTLTVLAADNTIGTWKLNMAQSKFTPGPSPVKSLTITREASDGGVKVAVTGECDDPHSLSTRGDASKICDPALMEPGGWRHTLSKERKQQPSRSTMRPLPGG